MADDLHDDLVSALQDALVPTAVPVLPGLDVAARFAIPPGAVEASGTWFDAVVLDDGRLALVIGEVPGTGLAAAAAMGQVSAVLRTALVQHQQVPAALEVADVHARHHDDARGTTLVVAVVDPDDGTVTYATAGHPAPIVTVAGQPSRQLDTTGGHPLGDGPGAGPRETGSHALEPGELVLLACTTMFRSTRLTGRALAHRLDDVLVAGDHEATTGALLEPALQLSRPDVVSLVLAQRRPTALPVLDLELPGANSSVGRARQELGSWLAEVDAPRMDAMAIVHAATELVANAVEHAQGPVRRLDSATSVRAELTADGSVVVEVVDRGSWHAPSEDLSRGRGLAMAAGLVDALQVSTGADGTRARISQRLCRPVRIQREEGDLPRSLVPSVVVDHTAPGMVSLHGSFGHDDVDRVAAELLLASRGGTRPLVVDLAGLTDLSATGVRLLADLVQPAHAGADPAPAVELHAPEGSTAHEELDRARIPHRAA